MKKRFLLPLLAAGTLTGLGAFGHHINTACVAGNADYEAGAGICVGNGRADDAARAQAAFDHKAAEARKAAMDKIYADAAEARQQENARSAGMTQDRAIGCAVLAGRGLKDPDSFRQLSTTREIQQAGVVEFTATNGFGGRVRGIFSCTTNTYVG